MSDPRLRVVSTVVSLPTHHVAGRRPRRLRPLWIVPVLGLLALLPSCSRDDPSRPDPPPVVILNGVREGQLAADTLFVSVTVDPPVDLDHVSLLVNGIGVATRSEAPWAFTWDPYHVRDSTWVRIGALAIDLQGRAVRSPDVRVLLVPNDDPLVRIIYPYPDHYIEIDRLGDRPWTCLAVDAEDGSLPDSRVEWREETRSVLGSGLEITPPPLDIGIRHIQVVARDLLGAAGVARRSVLIFRYPEGDGPAIVMAGLQLALRARDVANVAGLIHSDLLWSRCTAGSYGNADPPWTGDRVETALRRMIDDPALVQIVWQWSAGAEETGTIGGVPTSKIEIPRLDLTLRRDDAGRLVTTCSERNRERVYFRREGGRWKIWRWISLPRPGDPGDDGRLLDVLERYAGAQS